MRTILEYPLFWVKGQGGIIASLVHAPRIDPHLHLYFNISDCIATLIVLCGGSTGLSALLFSERAW